MNNEISNIDKSKIAKFLLDKGKKNLAEKKDIVEDPFIDIKTDPDGRYEPFNLCSGQEVHLMGRSGYFDMTAGSNCYQSFIFKNADIDFIDNIDLAFQKLIERHDALRITMINSKEQQVMKEVPKFHSVRKDLRHLEPAEAEQKVLEEHKTLVFKPGNPYQWPLFDIVVLILRDNTLVLCWRMDLFIYDFPSRLVITDEFFKFLKDPNVQLPKLDFRFRDYVKASIEAPKSLFFKKSKTYWERKMDTFPDEPQLPKVRNVSPGTQTPKSAFLSKIEAADWEKIKTIANKMSITPSVVASTAFSYVLRKFSKNEKFFIGLISFNRFDMHKQADDILGCFVQMIPLFFDFEAETFADYCKHSRNQLIEAMENRYYPGHMVLRDLHRIRKAGVHSLCPIMLTLLFEHKTKMEAFPDSCNIGNVTSEISFQQLSLPQLQLHPGMGEDPDGSFWCYWNHATGIYPDGLIKDMADSLTEILTLLSKSEDNWSKVSFESVYQQVVTKKESYSNLDIKPVDNVDNNEQLVKNEKNIEMSRRIMELIKNEFEIIPSSKKDNLYELGFSSLMIVRLLELLRQKLSLKVPQEILIGDITIEAIATRLSNVSSETTAMQKV